MSKKDKKPEETVEQVPTEPQQPEEVPEEAAPQETQAGQSQAETPDPLLTELESLKNQVAQQEDKFLRLAAEYDNYRRRGQIPPPGRRVRQLPPAHRQGEGVHLERGEGRRGRGLPPGVRQPGAGPEAGDRRRGL